MKYTDIYRHRKMSTTYTIGNWKKQVIKSARMSEISFLKKYEYGYVQINNLGRIYTETVKKNAIFSAEWLWIWILYFCFRIYLSLK